MSNPERWLRFKELPPNIREKLNQLIPLFQHEGVKLAYLFGSLSRQETGNDVDLAIWVEDKPAYQLRQAIMDCLSIERLDLVDLQQAPPVLKFEILQTGRLLFAADEATETNFVLSTLRQYKDTAWLRRHQAEILKERMAQWS